MIATKLSKSSKRFKLLLVGLLSLCLLPNFLLVQRISEEVQKSLLKPTISARIEEKEIIHENEIDWSGNSKVEMYKMGRLLSLSCKAFLMELALGRP